MFCRLMECWQLSSKYWTVWIVYNRCFCLAYKILNNYITCNVHTMYIQYTCTVLVVPIGTVTNKHNTHCQTDVLQLVDGTVGWGVLRTHTVASLLGISCGFVQAWS